MEYFFIIIAVTLFALQFTFTKLFEEKVGQAMSSTLIMIVATGMTGALLFFAVSGLQISFSPVSLMWAGFLAIIMIPYYAIGIKVLSLGSLAIFSMFMMLGGMLVPFFYGTVFLSEDVSVCKIIGTVLLALFIILQAVSQAKDERGGGSKRTRVLFFSLCLVIFFINGMTGVIAKAHSISEGAVDEMSFTATYALFTALLGLIFLVTSYLGNRSKVTSEAKKAMSRCAILIMCLLGIATYGGNFFLLLAAEKVPASVQFPLVSGGVIALSAAVSALFFREKISRTEWCSVIGAFASTFLFAF